MQKGQRGEWHTWGEGGEANQGYYSPEVIPPEHATDGNPGNSDRARDEEEDQGAICST